MFEEIDARVDELGAIASQPAEWLVIGLRVVERGQSDLGTVAFLP